MPQTCSCEYDAFPTAKNGYKEKYDIEVSDYDLISMPAGLCTNTLFCAWENCAPRWFKVGDQPAFDSARLTLGAFDTKTGDMEQLAKDIDVKFNLPDQIAFPTSVKDVVDVWPRSTRRPRRAKSSEARTTTT